VTEPTDPIARRRFLALVLASPFAVTLASRSAGRAEAAVAAAQAEARSTQSLLAAAAAGKLPATPECDDGEPTPRQTEGPFYTPDTPQRTSLLEEGMLGKRIEIRGRVFGRDCRPLAGAMLDFWQCDSLGEYDNEGFRLRGHQFADAEGRYALTTVVPGLYPGRTRHIHVRVQPEGGKVLTTQLYFPEEKRNVRDGMFLPELLLTMDDTGTPRRAHFHFVLDHQA
jgi:protocatechuate 3,4-dioxygenase beta subunit